MFILYKKDKQIGMLCPSPSWSGTLEELALKDAPEGAVTKIIEDSDSPDTDFIEAWESDDKLTEVTINLTKAKDITKDRLRVERKPLLEAQDILFMQAQEAGSDTSAIVAEKKRLRDITKDADSCTTTDELKALKVEAE
jgi:hypothetical protein